MVCMYVCMCSAIASQLTPWDWDPASSCMVLEGRVGLCTVGVRRDCLPEEMEREKRGIPRRREEKRKPTRQKDREGK